MVMPNRPERHRPFRPERAAEPDEQPPLRPNLLMLLGAYLGCAVLTGVVLGVVAFAMLRTLHALNTLAGVS